MKMTTTTKKNLESAITKINYILKFTRKNSIQYKWPSPKQKWSYAQRYGKNKQYMEFYTGTFWN